MTFSLLRDTVKYVEGSFVWKPVQLAGLYLLCSSASAQLIIGPTVVELGSKQKVAAVSVTLDEKAAAPMRLQADVLRWSQGITGDDVYADTAELLVTPPLAELRPGQRQIFRVALRGPRTAPEELAYRLILEDISESLPTAELSSNMKVHFRMRYDLPVMVAPVAAAVSGLQFKPCMPATETGTPPAAFACVRMLNTGNRRIKVQTLTVAGDGWQQAVFFKDGVNVLVGTEREWRITLEPGQTGALRSAQVQTARGEVLQAQAGAF